MLAGLVLATLGATLKFWNKPHKKKTMKFLTQDGKLVEIDVDKIPGAKKAANKQDIQNWVKKNKPV